MSARKRILLLAPWICTGTRGRGLKFWKSLALADVVTGRLPSWSLCLLWRSGGVVWRPLARALFAVGLVYGSGGVAWYLAARALLAAGLVYGCAASSVGYWVWAASVAEAAGGARAAALLGHIRL